MTNLIQINKIKKVVAFSVAEKVTMEEAKLFISEYNAKMKTINAAEYTLEVDCTSMNVLDQNMAANLTDVMKMYKETGFIKVIFKINTSPILKMQLARVARNAGLSEKASIVEVA